MVIHCKCVTVLWEGDFLIKAVGIQNMVYCEKI